jgi:exopolysaccharide biosynthesis polyprenyl glycosylphosphotransferase
MAALRSHIRSQITWIAVMDVVCLVFGSVVGVLLRFGPAEIGEYVFGHIDGWVLLYGCVVLANYLAGSYRLQYTFSRFNLVVTWFFSLVFGVFILSLTSYAWLTILLGRGVLFLSLACYSGIALFLKLLVYRSLFRSETFQCRAVILGAGDRDREVRRSLENEFVLPAHKVVAFIRVVHPGDVQEPLEGLIDGVAAVECPARNFGAIVRSLGISLIVAELQDVKSTAEIYPQLKRLRFDGVEVLTPLNVAEIYSGRTPLDLANEEVLMNASLESSLPVVRRIKRAFDLLCSIVGCVVLALPGLFIALLIKLSAPRSPVIYTQDRVGQFGRRFRILKFRTMRTNAEEGTGPVWCKPDDARVTRIGWWLRRFRLDEMPQFVNVMRGDMSVVGPRPERPEIVEDMERAIPFYRERENVMPGLTGWAQIQYPYGDSVQDARRKLEYDLYYVKNLSLSLDLQIILRTLRIVVLGKERKI